MSETDDLPPFRPALERPARQVRGPHHPSRLLVALVMVLYTFISLKYIHPDFKEKAYGEALKGLQQQPNIMPEEAKSQAKAYADNYIMTNVSLALMSTLIVSAVGSAIGAALAKKNQ